MSSESTQPLAEFLEVNDELIEDIIKQAEDAVVLAPINGYESFSAYKFGEAAIPPELAAELPGEIDRTQGRVIFTSGVSDQIPHAGFRLEFTKLDGPRRPEIYALGYKIEEINGKLNLVKSQTDLEGNSRETTHFSEGETTYIYEFLCQLIKRVSTHTRSDADYSKPASLATLQRLANLITELSENQENLEVSAEDPIRDTKIGFQYETRDKRSRVLVTSTEGSAYDTLCIELVDGKPTAIDCDSADESDDDGIFKPSLPSVAKLAQIRTRLKTQNSEAYVSV